MAKPRVHEIAKETGITSEELLKKLIEMGEYVSSASPTLEAPVVRKVREALALKPEIPTVKSAAPEPSAAGPTPCLSANRGRTSSGLAAVRPVATPGAPTPAVPSIPFESARPTPKPSPGRPSPKSETSRPGAAPKSAAPRPGDAPRPGAISHPGVAPRPGGTRPTSRAPGSSTPRPGARPGPRPGGSAPIPGSTVCRPGASRPGNNPFATSQGMGAGRPNAQWCDTGSRQDGDRRMPRPGGTGGLPHPSPAIMPKAQNSTLGQASVRGSGRPGDSGCGRPSSQGRPDGGGFGGPSMDSPTGDLDCGDGRGRGGSAQGTLGRSGAGSRHGRKSRKQHKQEFD